MTTKFSKQDSKRIADLIGKLGAQRDVIEAMWEPLAEMIDKINGEIDAYNEIVTEANGVVEDIASEVESYIDDKSDNWRDGERGSAMQDWLGELQNATLEEVEQIEVPEQPTLDHDGTLENIPEEASF